jgi:AcrR family transcriptional regulator
VTSQAGTRGPYAKTTQVRERIVRACAEAFAESGYRATTMKEVAARAEISERGLGHHFRSKEELLTAVLERHEKEAADRFPREAGIEGLQALLAGVIEDSAQPRLVELHSTLAAEAIPADHPAHEHYRERYYALRRYLTAAFEALDRQGDLQSRLAPAELAAAYIALSDGLQLQWLYDRPAVDPAAILGHFLEEAIPRLRQHPLAGLSQLS